MKKRMMLVIATLVVAGFFFGCEQNRRDEPMVSVSIAPLQYFVDRLTGESLDVNVMVPPGMSHGTYSPTAQQMQKLSDSEIYFQVGHLGYEQTFINRLHELNPDMELVNLSEEIELIRGAEIDHGDHVHEGGIDPHIWMSPKVILEILPRMKNALETTFPELISVINENYPVLLTDLQVLDYEMEEVVDGLSQKRFMIFHPALTYLARDYGMDQVSIEHEGKEPSASQLRHLIMEARAENIPVIFIQEEYDIRNADLVANETGAEVVQINPLAYNWLDSMQELMEVFEKHLQ